MRYFEQIFFRNYLLKMFCLEIFKKFKYISPKVLNIHASIKKNMLEVTILPSWVNNSRSSRPKVFYKKGVLRNFAKFTCARVSFLIKLQKETLAQVFSWEFYEISRNTFSYRTLPVAASATQKAIMTRLVLLINVGKIIVPEISLC